MDFNHELAKIFASGIIVLRRCLLLIISPYKTMKKISEEKDYYQTLIIIFFIFIYFEIANRYIRFTAWPSVKFLFFITQFLYSVLFFWVIGRIWKKDIRLRSVLLTLSYTLIPTLLWFIADSMFYTLIPPPRTTSYLGKAFSIFFTSFSISILFWKIMLVYLALRFSSKLNIYKILYMLIFYICLILPYSLFLYYLKIFRIPFI